MLQCRNQGGDPNTLQENYQYKLNKDNAIDEYNTGNMYVNQNYTVIYITS